MLRKSLVPVLLMIAIVNLSACRRGGEAALPTPAGTAIVLPTTAATVPVTAATSTIATAVPLPSPTNTATPPVPSTATTGAPAATATLAPPATAAATATVNAGPPPGGSARINFAPGATSATVNSVLAAGGDGDTWLLRVSAGQTITVQTIASPPGNIVVSLMDMNGRSLATNADTTGISAAVPATGDYQINLATASGAPGVSYTMQVLVPPGNGPVAPTRIQFAPGQASAQVPDSLAAGGDLNSYVVRVGAGQTIQVGVFASPPAATNIYIRDTAGQLLTSGTDMSGASVTAAVAGDYFIDVSNFNAAPAVNYTLTVTVPPLNPPPPTQPVRIEFGPGQTSAELNGQVAVGLPPVEYIIRVMAGQTLITNVNSNPQAAADVTVRDTAGNVLNFGRSPTELGTTIPSGGDYVIVISTMNTNAVAYTLRVSVPPLPGADTTRIEFAPGATSATVTGDLPFGGDLDNWVIRALAGQTMNVSLRVNEATGWVNIFVYNDVNQLIGSGTDASGAAVPLATTGDYRIVVSSIEAAGPLSYALTVDIR